MEVAMFFHTLQLQIFQLFHRKHFLILFTVILFYCLLCNGVYIWEYLHVDYQCLTSASSIYVGNERVFLYDVLKILFPLLVAIPFATTAVSDRATGVLPSVMSRTSLRTFYTTKLIACFIGGFLLFFIPFLINVLINHISFPSSLYLDQITQFNPLAIERFFSDGTPYQASDSYLFSSVFYWSPFFYNFIYIVIYSAFSGICSSFCYSTGLFVKKYQYLVCLPLLGFAWGTQILDTMTLGKVEVVNTWRHNLVKDYYQYLVGGTTGVFYFSPLVLAAYALLLILSTLILVRKKLKLDQFG